MPAKELPVLTYKELNERQWHCNINQNPWPPRYTPAQLVKGSWVILVEALFSLLFSLIWKNGVLVAQVENTWNHLFSPQFSTPNQTRENSVFFPLFSSPQHPPPPFSIPQLSSKPKTVLEFNFSSPDKHNIVLLWKQF